MFDKSKISIEFLDKLVEYIAWQNSFELTFEERYTPEEVAVFESYVKLFPAKLDNITTCLNWRRLKLKLIESTNWVEEGKCFNTDFLGNFSFYDITVSPELIEFSFFESVFGLVIIASTNIGICYVAFENEREEAFAKLLKRFPDSSLVEASNFEHNKVKLFFENGFVNKFSINLHLKNTAFQLEVWKALISIPQGRIVTYSDIANYLNKHNGSRAVGSAVGDNPIAALIPCHRVLPQTGIIGEYAWGSSRKSVLIAYELAKES